MNNISQVPKLNNIQMIPEDYPISPGAHSLPFDKQWFSEHIKQWQENEAFEQPVEMLDRQFLYIDLESGAQYVRMSIYNCSRETEVVNVTPFYRLTDTGSSYMLADGSEVPMIPNVFTFAFADYVSDEGTYFIRLECKFDETTTRYWISEPIDVRGSHPDTVYIKAWNETNRQDVVFIYGNQPPENYFISPKFGLRVKGAILDPEQYTSNNVEFKEQDYEQRNLNSTAWIVKKLLTGAEGAPPYIQEKVNEYLSADVVYIDGRRVVKNEGADWQVETNAQYPMYENSIEIRDWDRRDSFTDKRGSLIELFAEPVNFPTDKYAIYEITLITPSGDRVRIMENRPIYTTTDRNNTITEMNTTRATRQGLTGLFSYSAGKWYYQNGLDENYSVDSERLLILFGYSIYTVLTTTSNQTWGELTVNGGRGVIDWADGNVGRINTTGGAFIQTKLYATANTYRIYIFHEDAIKQIFINNTGYTPKLINVGGNLPMMCEEFEVYRADFSAVVGGFNMIFLANCRRYIKRIRLFRSGIVDLNGNVFNQFPATGILGDSRNWRLINYLDINLNGLSRTEIEDFINYFYQDTTHLNTGYLNLQQSPAVTLTNTTTIGYVTNLRNAGCTVNILP